MTTAQGVWSWAGPTGTGLTGLTGRACGLALALALVLAGCGGGGGGADGGADGGAVGGGADTAATDRPVVVDSSRTSTATLGPLGGRLSATAADGTRYTLEVPADALAADTAISLTPITSLGSAPLARGLGTADRAHQRRPLHRGCRLRQRRRHRGQAA